MDLVADRFYLLFETLCCQAHAVWILHAQTGLRLACKTMQVFSVVAEAVKICLPLVCLKFPIFLLVMIQLKQADMVRGEV